MTTSDQPSPPNVDELEALRRAAREPRAVDAGQRDALQAKGMLQDDGDGMQLTPAGRHALDIGDGPTVPGLDN
ncbi:hypothetical protein [Cognatilysobacter bugurensis]|uniref:Uncharacterized protein n=1 Tax=Cognatilysobacter bugurensis TaxID=543356 RepID=A0A918T0T7_9GAMM|nr:hypothetical protein [Lysobacter bugurensis]GHA83586.1 hypothetical protein GCM10007067_22130 [Lysobacter bugurensis]